MRRPFLLGTDPLCQAKEPFAAHTYERPNAHGGPDGRSIHGREFVKITHPCLREPNVGRTMVRGSSSQTTTPHLAAAERSEAARGGYHEQAERITP